MKTLSVKNPWAWLICSGYKDVENRTWKTNYRGKILIHASLKWDCHKGELCSILNVLEWDAIPIPNRMELSNHLTPSGAIIGEAEIIDIINNSKSIWAAEGQYHWILKNQKLYDKPIPAKGSLGLWEFDCN